MISGRFCAERTLDRARHLFSHHRAHRSADEAETPSSSRSPDGRSAWPSAVRIASFISSFCCASLEPRGVGLVSWKCSGSLEARSAIVLGPRFVIEQQLEPPPRAEAEMLIALGTDFPVRFEILLPDDRAAGAALRPQPFGADAALVDGRRILDRFFLALKPGHLVDLNLAACSPNNRFPAARECLSCTDASLRASRSPDRRPRPASDARCAPCRSRGRARAASRAIRPRARHRASCS